MNWLIAAATWLYHLLLRLYPRGFRATFAEEMGDVFTAVAHDAAARGWLALCTACVRELAGLALCAPLAWGSVIAGHSSHAPRDHTDAAGVSVRPGGSNALAIGGAHWLMLRRLPLISLAALTLAAVGTVALLIDASPRRLSQSVAAVRVGTDTSHVWISGHAMRCATGVAPNHVVCSGVFEGQLLEVTAWIHDERGAPRVSGCSVHYDSVPRRCRVAYEPYAAGWLPFVIVEESLGVGEERLRELRLRDLATNATEAEIGLTALLAAGLFALNAVAIVFQHGRRNVQGWRRVLWGVIALGGGGVVFVATATIFLFTLLRLGYMD